MLERGAVDAQRRLLLPVAVDEGEVEALRHGEVDLVGRQGELLANDAPNLHVDLGAVKGRLIGHFDIRHLAVVHGPAHHCLGLEPQALVVDVFLAQSGFGMRAQAHQVLVDAEDLEVLVVQVDHAHELLLEQVFGDVEVGVVHLHRAHAHQPEQLAGLLEADSRYRTRTVG